MTIDGVDGVAQALRSVDAPGEDLPGFHDVEVADMGDEHH